MYKVLLAFLAVLALCCGGRCDTMHFVNDRMLNGHVVSYGGSGNNGEFYVVFKFSSGEAEISRKIRRSEIEDIEFNKTDSNQGPPPPWFTSGNETSSPKDAMRNPISVTPSPPKRDAGDPSVEVTDNNVLEQCADDIVSFRRNDNGEEKYTGTLISIDEKTGKLTIEIKQESTKPTEPVKAKKKFIKMKKSIEHSEIYRLVVGECH